MRIQFVEQIEQIGEHLNAIHSLESFFIITDSNCAPLAKHFSAGIHPAKHHIYIYPAGESSKNLDTYQSILEFLTKHNAQRHTSAIVAVGGGVCTDMAGFAASSYQRGIPFYSIPTSLMAMVDAAHGGKVGINLHHYKNYIGSFYEPNHIYIYTKALNSLPEVEMLSGFAEVLKHGLALDHFYWEGIKSLNPLELSDVKLRNIIERSIELKDEVTKADFKEIGERKKLNFGHTVGHAIESVLMDKGQPSTHGACVAAGMIVESHISYLKELLTETEFEEIESNINLVYSKLPITPSDIPALLEYMRFDKKNDSSEANFTLLNGIGHAIVNQTAMANQIEEALTAYINS